MLAKVYKIYCDAYKNCTTPWLVICLEANYAVHFETEKLANKFKKLLEINIKEKNIKAHPEMENIVNECK